ncbi:AfsR/SARP family transcriptional regulator, partial [Streptomyces anulatus]|uniref:AfsR/SARP family transcriptional regulator n=1 Tax=Streptomyces anulatus TaxID=1892 RepID=UPI00342DA477
MAAGVTAPFRILGPIELHNGEAPISISPGRQPIILGALLFQANHVVSTEHLIDAVWDEDPPPSARNQVQICISALRRLLALVPAKGEITRRPPGYCLQISLEDLDSHRFDTLVREAEYLTRANSVEAAATLRQALALWRGPALSGVASRLLEGKALRLDEARLAALESCIDIELGLGRHR